MGGSTSREVFEKIVARLSSEDVDPADHQFWDDMWKTTLTVEVEQTRIPLRLTVAGYFSDHPSRVDSKTNC